MQTHSPRPPRSAMVGGMTPPPPPAGRPSLPEDQRKAVRIPVALTAEQRDRIHAAAERAGVKPSEFIRAAALRAAARKLRD